MSPKAVQEVVAELSADVRAILEPLLEQRQAACARRDEAIIAVGELTEVIKTFVGGHLSKTQIGAFMLAIREQAGRKTIKAEKLLELGVSADVIQRATEEGKSFTVIDVDQAKP